MDAKANSENLLRMIALKERLPGLIIVTRARRESIRRNAEAVSDNWCEPLE